MACVRTDFSRLMKFHLRNVILSRGQKQAEAIEVVRKVLLLPGKHVFHALAAPKCRPPF